jgi:small subunit ribosomal protein S6
MRHYEIIYIVSPNLGEEEYPEVIDKFNDLVGSQDGIVIKTQKWGKQRLAYQVKKFNYGFYVLVEFCANSGVTSELERALKLDDRIIKYQTIKLADKADPEELLQKEKDKNKVEEPEEKREKVEEPAKEVEETAKESEVKDGE